MRRTASKATPTTSPEGALLLTNPRINPTTGVPYTTEAEKRAIKEILNKRHKRLLEEEDEEEEAIMPKKRKSSPRRTSRDLIAKENTTGGPQSDTRDLGKG